MSRKNLYQLNANQDREFEKQLAFFLNLRLYEQRGMTKEEYIAKCKSLWDECEVDEEYEYKLLIDRLMPISEWIKAANLDYDDELFQNKPNYEEERPSLYCAAVALFKPDGTKVKKNDVEKNPLNEDPPELRPMPYIISLFDVLGFKNRLRAMGIEKLLEMYQRIIDNAVLKDAWRSIARVQVGEKLYSPIMFNLPVRYSYFSDTILLWVPLVPYFVAAFTARCADLICEALQIGLPLRGSLTIGEAVMNKSKNTYLGEPIVESARLEKAQKWIGLSFTQFSARH